MKFQSPRGTRDLLFEQADAFARLEKACAEIFHRNHYRLIRTPIFESAELFKRSVGEDTDIVEKEMFLFRDRGDREYALRPEGTAPVARAFIEHGLAQKGKFTRLYYFGPMFRAERPQAGRYREFWQAGAEYFGIKEPNADADVITLLNNLLRSVSNSSLKFSINLNSLGCPECRPDFRKALEKFLGEHKDELCEDCRRRMAKNPLRVLDCKIDAQKLTQAPTSTGFLCPACKDHFSEVQNLLHKYNCPFALSPRLVRGLDYYTGAVFEAVSDSLGAQNALAAGGRYDQLVESLGGPPTPAVGFAIGLDRLIEALGEQGTPSSPREGAFIVALGPAAAEEGLRIRTRLLENSIACPSFFPNESMKAQMRSAGSSGARWAVIIGDNELNQKPPVAMIKDLNQDRGVQQAVPLSELPTFLKNLSS